MNHELPESWIFLQFCFAVAADSVSQYFHSIEFSPNSLTVIVSFYPFFLQMMCLPNNDEKQMEVYALFSAFNE